MDKTDIIKILVAVIVIGFITEQFYFGYIGGSKRPTTLTGGQNITGTAVFNGTIRTYDPILGLPVDTNQSIIDQLRSMDGVKDVTAQNSVILVQTETRDDVYPLAVFLRQNNVTSFSIANIALPPLIEVSVDNAKINVTTNNAIVRVQTEPLLDADSDVTVSMSAVVNDELLVGYDSPNILLNRITLETNATLASLNYKTYRYIIPWESRNSLNNLSEYDYHYTKVNTIIFNPPLTIAQVLAKKVFPYLIYIDASSAEVVPEFSNSSQVLLNFEDTNVTFPSSLLEIKTNETPDLSFDYTVRYTYLLTLPQTLNGYELGNISFLGETATMHELNTTMPLNVTIIAIGNKVISVSPSGLSS